MQRADSETARTGARVSSSDGVSGVELPGVIRLPRKACIWFLLIVAVTAGCGRDSRPAAPYNLILISIDTLRRDHVGCYGYPQSTTPTIDRLAESGMVFDNAVSSSSWTLPAHASMLTGLYPAFHRLQDDGTRLAPSIPTLAEGLRDAGYSTLAVVSHVYVSSQFGLERGFDLFDDSLIQGGAETPVASDVADRVLEQMANLPEGPYFAFVHFFDPHWDYTPPAPFDARFTDPGYAGPIDGTLKTMMPYLASTRPMPRPDLEHAVGLYDGEIAYVDAEIGRLLGVLREQGRLKNTVVVVTSDHGEEFKEHGRLGHGKSLFWEQLRVPLVVSGHPDFPRGRREDLVSLVDLAPTLLALAGSETPPRVQGASMLERRRSEARVVYAESVRFGNEMRAARAPTTKVIHYFQGDARYFYDLSQDPRETRPLTEDPSAGKLSSALADYALVADSGWHMKLISLGRDPMKCRATVRTPGRFVYPCRYFSGHVDPPSGARFFRFDLGPDGHVLDFEVELTVLMGEVTFETDPPDAPVTFEVGVRSASAAAGVFLGSGERIPMNEPVTLERSDARLAGTPVSYTRTPPGCYIRTVTPPAELGPKTDLSEEAVERLRSLGYISSGEDLEE